MAIFMACSACAWQLVSPCPLIDAGLHDDENGIEE
jgi:hypothetical protein